MIVRSAISDQLYTWSAPNEEHSDCLPTTTSQNALASVPTPGGGAAGLAYRTLQALRQAGLQMCPRSGPRPQVLFVGEPHRRAPRNGLCPPRPPTAGGAVCGQLPADPRDSRAALCDQSRAAAPARAFLSSSGERHHPRAHRPARHRSCRHPHRQYARSCARGGHRGLGHWGGER